MDFEVALCQNETKVVQSIKEIKTKGDTNIQIAKATYVACAMTILEAETAHTTAVAEVELIHTADTRKLEADYMAHSHTLQQSHKKHKYFTENEYIETEGHEWLLFLKACWSTIQDCYPEACGVLMYLL